MALGRGFEVPRYRVEVPPQRLACVRTECVSDGGGRLVRGNVADEGVAREEPGGHRDRAVGEGRQVGRDHAHQPEPTIAQVAEACAGDGDGGGLTDATAAWHNVKRCHVCQVIELELERYTGGRRVDRTAVLQHVHVVLAHTVQRRRLALDEGG